MEYQVALIFGLGIIGISIFKTYRMIDGSSWPETNGKIVRSATRIGINGTRWPDIQYQYWVNGLEYTGNRISLGGLWGLFGRYDWVYELVKLYSIGADVTVFYNPRNPKASCLRKEGWSTISILYIVGLFFVYAGYSNL